MVEGLESRQLLAAVSGVVFHDRNGNGVFDQSDSVLSGRTVFIDQNRDGVLSPGETSTSTVGGRYFLNGDANGQSTLPIGQVLPGGWKATRSPLQTSGAATTHEASLFGADTNLGSVPVGNTFVPAVDPFASGVILSDPSATPVVTSFGNAFVHKVIENGVHLYDELRFFDKQGNRTGNTVTFLPGEAQYVVQTGLNYVSVVGRHSPTGELVVRKYLNGFQRPMSEWPFNGAYETPITPGQVSVSDVKADRDSLDLYVAGRLFDPQTGQIKRFVLKFGQTDIDYGFGVSGFYTEDVPDEERELSASEAVYEKNGVLFFRRNAYELVRLSPDGQLDRTFADNGVLKLNLNGTPAEIKSVQIDPLTSDLVIGGQAGATPIIGRFSVSGTQYTNFGNAPSGFITLSPADTGPRGFRNVVLNSATGDVRNGYVLAGRAESVSNLGDAFVAFFDANGRLRTDIADRGFGTYNLTGYDDAFVSATETGGTIVGGNRIGHVTFARPEISFTPGLVTVDADGKIRQSLSVVDKGSPVAGYEWDLNPDPDGPFTADFAGQSVTIDAQQSLRPGANTLSVRVRNATGLYGYESRSIWYDRFVSDETTVGSDTTVSFASAAAAASAKMMRATAASAASLRYSFDFNNDGDFTDAGDVLNADLAKASYRFGKAGTYVVRGRISAADGTATDFLTNALVKAATTPPTTPTVVNLSKGKAASSSSSNAATRTAAMAFDGSQSTRWAASAGDAAPWLRVDLGQVSTLTGVTVNWEYGYAKSYKIQSSADGVTWADVYATAAGDGKTDELKNLTGSGRYVRLLATQRGTTSPVSAYEVSIFGYATGTTPTPQPPTPQPPTGEISGVAFHDVDGDLFRDPGEAGVAGYVFLDKNNNALFDSATETLVPTAADGTYRITGLAAGSYNVRRFMQGDETVSRPNSWGVSVAAGQKVTGIDFALTLGGTSAITDLAKGKPASASSSNATTRTADKAFDGNASTRWAASAGDAAPWLRVDLGQTSAISSIKLNWEYGYAKGYKLQVSDNGTTWRDVYVTTTGDGKTDEITGLNATGRYVRMLATARGTTSPVSLYDVQVFGRKI